MKGATRRRPGATGGAKRRETAAARCRRAGAMGGARARPGPILSGLRGHALFAALTLRLLRCQRQRSWLQALAWRSGPWPVGFSASAKSRKAVAWSPGAPQARSVDPAAVWAEHSPSMFLTQRPRQGDSQALLRMGARLPLHFKPFNIRKDSACPRVERRFRAGRLPA